MKPGERCFPGIPLIILVELFLEQSGRSALRVAR
jgi:hypothetical protein